ncbi:MAG TPA: hypothetical protein VGO94_01515 [Mycobacteriales bacterium]|nr:hypothetical protein [Mycobacteriales bacterium]
MTTAAGDSAADTPPTTAPADQWRALAHLVASQPRMRLSPDGGRNYPGRYERPLSRRLPAQPAAVRTYDTADMTHCFAADLDTGRGGADRVVRDTADLTALIEGCGGRVVVDTGPTGGRHVYLPLTQPVPHVEARLVALALSRLFGTLDPTPMTSAASGCIRPPGAWHKSRGGRARGHQQLLTPLPQALSTFTRRNPADVWQRLVAALAPQIAAIHGTRHTPPVPALHRTGGTPAGTDTELAAARAALAPNRRRSPLTGDLARVALTGKHDTARYATASEARQAIVASLYWRGHSYDDVAAALHTGIWPGLAALYRRAGTPLPRLLAHEWLVAARLTDRRTSSLHSSPTRVSTTRGGSRPSRSTGTERDGDVADIYGWLRTWWNSVLLAERARRYRGQGGESRRMALRALGWAAQCAGDLEVEFGTRALGLSAGKDATTIAAALRELAADPDPFLVKIVDAAGVHADRYRLRIPDGWFDTAAGLRWRPGSIEALHPAFRPLGTVAGLVYEVLDAEGATGSEVASSAAVSDRAAHTALHLLAEEGLATYAPGRGWTRGPVNPDAVAAANGGFEAAATVSARYRAERTAWHTYLGVAPDHDGQTPRDSLTRDPLPRRATGLPSTADREWHLDEPTDDTDPVTLYDLLHRELDATLVPP